MPRLPVSLFVAVSLLACGRAADPVDQRAEQLSSPSTRAPCRQTVDGRRVKHFVVDGQVVARTAEDFAGWDLSAIDADGQAHTATFSGASFSLGTPGGPYFLRVNQPLLAEPAYFASDERHLDLDEYFLGRADAVVASPGTQLALSLTGLSPFTPGDDLQLTSAGAGLGFGSFLWAADTAPSAGATSLAAVVNYADLTSFGNGGLIDARRGDTVFVSQLLSQPLADGDEFYALSLGRAARVDTLTMVNGAASPLSASLSAVPQTQRLDTVLARGAFDAIKTDINPHAEPVSHDLGVDAAPGSLAFGSISGTPDLALLGVAPGTSPHAVHLAYGNPYPASWPAFGFIVTTYQVALEVDGVPYRPAARAIVNAPVSAFATSIAPGIGPVRHARLDGQALSNDLRPASTRPTLTWDAPAFGHPDAYVVSVHELAVDAAAGTVSAHRIAKLTTEARTLRLPPDLLVKGGRYTVTITAVASPGIDPAERPFQRHYPMSATDSISGILSP